MNYSRYFHIVDEERKTVAAGKFRNRADAIRRVFAGRDRLKIVIEASCKAFWMADCLSELGHQVVVVDPGRTRAIGAARIKHDKLDARILAELCQSGLLAAVDIPSLESGPVGAGNPPGQAPQGREGLAGERAEFGTGTVSRKRGSPPRQPRAGPR